MTLQILFAPATNALGRPGASAVRDRPGRRGDHAARLPAGIQYGDEGLAWAWLVGLPLLLAATVEMSLPVIGVQPARLVPRGRARPRRRAAMAGLVEALDALLPAIARRRPARYARGRPAWPSMPACCSPSRGRSSTRCSRFAPDGRSRCRSDALNIGAHRLGFVLDPVHPVGDEVADRDEADQAPALDHRQMADAAAGHLRQGDEPGIAGSTVIAGAVMTCSPSSRGSRRRRSSGGR